MTTVCWRHRLALPLLLLGLSLSGCAEKVETPAILAQLTPVSGKITLDGQPLAGVMVTYLRSETAAGGETASGLTTADGTYTLQTYVVGHPISDTQGAAPGQYRVVIQKLVLPDGSAVPPETTDADAEALGARQLLPRQYSDPSVTRLTAVVNATEPNTNNFELKKGS